MAGKYYLGVIIDEEGNHIQEIYDAVEHFQYITHQELQAHGICLLTTIPNLDGTFNVDSLITDETLDYSSPLEVIDDFVFGFDIDDEIEISDKIEQRIEILSTAFLIIEKNSVGAFNIMPYEELEMNIKTFSDDLLKEQEEFFDEQFSNLAKDTEIIYNQFFELCVAELEKFMTTDNAYVFISSDIGEHSFNTASLDGKTHSLMLNEPDIECEKNPDSDIVYEHGFETLREFFTKSVMAGSPMGISMRVYMSDIETDEENAYKKLYGFYISPENNEWTITQLDAKRVLESYTVNTGDEKLKPEKNAFYCGHDKNDYICGYEQE